MAPAYAVAHLTLSLLSQLPLHQAPHGPPPHLAMGRISLVASPLPVDLASAKVRAGQPGDTDAWRPKAQYAS